MSSHEDPTQVSPASAPTGAHQTSAYIGAYRIIRPLGEGGMGVVYLAEQGSPLVRQVAVKVLKRGMDSREFVARFEAERQALARMDHPGIARVYDAGATPNGRPYFVMEVVEGAPITDYCDRARLSPRDRVALMIDVCRAVQHAHQKGVIHRDLKPSNVLVSDHDGRRAPKVIDFGVARAVTQGSSISTMLTEVGQRIGTPAYMSPEQMAGSSLDIDTRTDIYALGVILYELLTGTRPFSDELLRRAVVAPDVLRTTDVQIPSARVRSSASNSAEAATLRDTNPQALGRAIAGDLDWITLKAMSVDRTGRYETATGLAADLQRSLDFEPVVARPPSRRDRVAKFARRHRVGVAVSVAVAILVIASTIALAFLAQRLTRERDRAEREAARATAVTTFLRDTLSAADPWSGGTHDVTVSAALTAAAARVDTAFRSQPLVGAAVRATIADTESGLGRFDQAESLALAALATQKRVLGDVNEDAARTLQLLSSLYQKKGQYQLAETRASEALAMHERLTGRRSEGAASSLSDLARSRLLGGKYQEARAPAEEAVAIRRELYRKPDERTADSLTTLASIMSNGFADYARAGELLREALTIRRAVGPDNAHVALVLNDLAVNSVQTGKYPEAEKQFQESLAIQRRTLGEDHPEVAASLENLGSVYYRTKRYNEALAILDQVLAMRRRKLGDGHTAVGRTLANMGAVRNAAHDYTNAIPSLIAAEQRLSATLGAEHPELVTVLLHLGDAYAGAHRQAEGEATYRKAIALAEKSLPAGHAEIGRAKGRLGSLLLTEKRYAEAEPMLLAGFESRKKTVGVDHAATKSAAADLVRLYDALGQPDKAAPYRSSSSGFVPKSGSGH